MYLLISPLGYTISQSATMRTDANFLGWLFDNHGKYFRFHEGRFQQLRVFSAARPYPSKVIRWNFEWVDVPEKEP